MIQSSGMDDLAALLETCRLHTGATAAALVGRDGLVIERAGAGDTVGGADLALGAAEATDLFGVADRLLMDAFAAGEALECRLSSRDTALHLARLREGAFVLLVLPAGSDPTEARAALDAARIGLEAGLA